jgi:hypothetical protein
MAINPTPAPGDSGSSEKLGPTLLATVRAELADERMRQGSIESRALTLAAGAATAAALVLGLGGRYGGRWATLFFIVLGVAGVLFLLSIGFAWWSVRLVNIEQLDIVELGRLVDGGALPEGREVDPELYVATGLMSSLQDARTADNKKTKWFERAFYAFLLGVCAVAVEIGVVILDKVLAR